MRLTSQARIILTALFIALVHCIQLSIATEELKLFPVVVEFNGYISVDENTDCLLNSRTGADLVRFLDTDSLTTNTPEVVFEHTSNITTSDQRIYWIPRFPIYTANVVSSLDQNYSELYSYTQLVKAHKIYAVAGDTSAIGYGVLVYDFEKNIYRCVAKLKQGKFSVGLNISQFSVKRQNSSPLIHIQAGKSISQLNAVNDFYLACNEDNLIIYNYARDLLVLIENNKQLYLIVEDELRKNELSGYVVAEGCVYADAESCIIGISKMNNESNERDSMKIVEFIISEGQLTIQNIHSANVDKRVNGIIKWNNQIILYRRY